jgi:hypothetical protein
MNVIDIALLRSEWVGRNPTCPCCKTYPHASDCPMDAALSMRGYTTPEARSKARKAYDDE